MSAFTEEELGYLLSGRKLARVATVGADGTPHVMPVGWSLSAELDAIEIGGHDFARTKKFRDVRRSGRAAVVIDDLASTDPWRPRGVEVRGRGEAVEGERPMIRVHPERIVSWGIGDGSSSRAVGAPPMEEIVPGLRASAPLRLPFGRDLHARAYLLEREHGNVLLYGAAALEPHLAEVEALGGLTRQYLNHSHEATPEANTVAQRFGAPLFVHAADSADTARAATVRATFDRRHHLDDDLEIIPIPGHTPGATAYLWDTGEHRALFTGDSLYLRDGDWRAALLDGVSDRETYVASLELLRGLDFDVLVPGIVSGGGPGHVLTDPVDARERIDAVVARLRAGADH